MLTTRPSPLADITNVRAANLNKMEIPFRTCSGVIPESSSTKSTPLVRINEPYRWKCLPEDEHEASAILAQRTSPLRQLSFSSPQFDTDTFDNCANPNAAVCRTLVQFKCHQGEYSSPLNVEKGQYVVVQGDRGIDIGVVIRINTDAYRSYVERSGPVGNILRHATQREVDYWATELKIDESAAVDFCQQRVVRNNLPMEVRHAEYQFDKKKLTFYYTAHNRVDFVQLLKELYREYGCRIWMEKVVYQE